MTTITGYYTAREAAEMLGLSKDTILHRLNRARIPGAYKSRHGWHIPHEYVAAQPARGRLPAPTGWLYIDDATVMLGRSAQTVYAYTRNGKLRTRQGLWGLEVNEEDVVALINAPQTRRGYARMEGCVTAREAASILQCSISCVLQHHIPRYFKNAVKQAYVWSIPLTDIEAYLRHRRRPLGAHGGSWLPVEIPS